MEPRKCRVCGKSIPAGKTLHTCVVRLTDVECCDIVTLDMIFCESCHEAFDLTDLIEAAKDAIIAELREARQPCITTSRCDLALDE